MSDAGPMLYWAISRKPTRPGAWLGTSDLCHLHPTRVAAERCGIVRPGAPELVAVKVDAYRPRLFRVAYSLSHTAAGRLRPGLTIRRKRDGNSLG